LAVDSADRALHRQLAEFAAQKLRCSRAACPFLRRRLGCLLAGDCQLEQIFRAGGGKLKRRSEDQALPAEEFAAKILEAGEPVALCGDAVELLRPYLPKALSPLAAPDVLRASCVAAAAAQQLESAVAPEALSPVYLSLSRAEK
jgi:tRNA A37 threonylcarbamoyladenosine modification protein TsaB